MLSGETVPPKKLKVFVCHASEDHALVEELAQRLEANGINVWTDEKRLYPGLKWETAIRRAIEEADAAILCLSKISVKKEGYVQKELRIIFEVSSQKPDDANFVIPVRLDECEVPTWLASYQWGDYFPESERDSSFAKIKLALDTRSKIMEERKLQRSTNETREVLSESHALQDKRDELILKKPSDAIREVAPLSSNARRNKFNLSKILPLAIIVIALIVLTILVSQFKIPLLSPTATRKLITPTMFFVTRTPNSTSTNTSIPPSPTKTVLPPTDTPTLVPSDTPTFTPDPRCIDISTWTLSSTDHSSPDVIGTCYDLNVWGISVLNNTYSFLMYGGSRAELYGLSEPVQKDISVTFHLKVNLLREGEFWFGISEDADPLQDGIYFVVLPYGKFRLRTYRNGYQVNDAEINVPYGSSYDVKLTLEGTRLTPIINVYDAGTWIYANQLVQFSQRRFYMGIRPLANGFVDAILSSLSTNP